MCIPNMFYKLKRLQIKQIRDKVTLALRKCKKKGAQYTAGDFLSPAFVEKLTLQDDGYRVLRTIRGSPPYWEHAKRDIFSMIRQLGIPTWFCSFSAAETKWVALLVSLFKLVHGKDITEQEARNLSWQEKSLLIKSDPVTCARFFDFRVQTFIRHVIKSSHCPIGRISDYFYRVEFQQRGSPHIHMLVWVENAPVYGQHSHKEIAAFVTKYVTCKKDAAIADLINYQTHRHAKTCRKKGKSVCRFNFPLPPMPETVVLDPLQTGENTEMYCKKYELVLTTLNSMYKEKEDISFESFLAGLEMTFDEYLMVIRSSLQRTQVYLKRSVAECRVNNYNSLLLYCWQANMDIQYIMDPYACVSYVVSYISKGQRGLSNLLEQACTEAKGSNYDLRQQVRHIGNQFLTHVEIGAQEAAYLLLQIPLRKCTRDVVYVDVKTEADRTVLIKPLSALQELPKNSINIEMDSVLKRYKRRPKSIESLIYADFATWYDLCPPDKQTVLDLSADEPELPEQQHSDMDSDDDISQSHTNHEKSVIRFPCGTKVRKRVKQKVLYSCTMSINENKEEYFRQKIMLYTHWRDENSDLLSGFQTYEESYKNRKEQIMQNQIIYEKLPEDIEHFFGVDEDCLPLVQPETEHQESLDCSEGISASATYGCFDPGDSNLYDLGSDLSVKRKNLDTIEVLQTEVTSDEYLKMVRLLNSEQKKIFYHILHCVKTGKVPFHIFLSGGAGVGKSVLVKALHQSLVRVYNHRQGEDPSLQKVLLCAPTGKAAHNIGGMTVHSAFCIPANQSFQFKPLDAQQLNTLRAKLLSLQVVIIDEISMGGRGMFNYINRHLQEIMGVSEAFGGLSILAVGDLFQLKPVLDAWIFSTVYTNCVLECLAPNIWTDLFQMYELTRIMRQEGDKEFAELLNRLREGNHTTDDVQILLQRKLESSNSSTGSLQQLPHLFCTRQAVSDHNKSILSQVQEENQISIDAIDTVSGDLSPSLQAAIVSRIPDDPSKTKGLVKTLKLGIDLPGELCLNISIEDGLTNGAACLIRKFDFRVEGSLRCSIVWVQFESENIGKVWRTKYKHLFRTDIPSEWTPIFEVTRNFTYSQYKTYNIVRRQFPITLAAGRTIHKAQGATLKEVVLDFGTRKIDHIHYVGLSRVTNLAGVHIKTLNETKVSTSVAVLEEMSRLRSEKELEVCVPDMEKVSGIIVYYHNCRSLRKYFTNICSEESVLLSDLVCLSETRVPELQCTQYQIPGFQLVCADQTTLAHGMAVYKKTESTLLISKVDIFCQKGVECVIIHCRSEMSFAFVYCRPKDVNEQNYRVFMESLNSYLPGNQSVVMMGDFNFDHRTNTNLVSVIGRSHKLKQILRDVSTDYDSAIDHIYTNVDLGKVRSYGTFESYYSDHKPLFVVMEKQIIQ